MRKVMIAGNWKMNTTWKESKQLAERLDAGLQSQTDLPTIIICPPFTSLPALCQDRPPGSPLKIGAQNMDHRDSGAFTGEISPPMLAALKVKHVLIGHSERRQFFGETDEGVNLKLKSALKHAMTAIVCVGETLAERDRNLTDNVVTGQVRAALEGITADQLAASSLADLKGDEPRPLVIAYEPVWAIGTGKVCEAPEAERVTRLIRSTVEEIHHGLGERVTVLYGGSVTAGNIEELLARPDIDGGLVGGASLKDQDFLAIIAAGRKRQQLAASAK